ncbi:MAG: MBL fold metallo-hydrolase [Candidatus Aenigmarchaeota archaeon]|nr:MBL fold metallo-hydrolase [Candidatus Aenigmarchaeota archaeon]
MNLRLIKLNSPNSNIYLIDEDVLIDTGCGLEEEKEIFETKLKQCNSSFDKIKTIILTHCHFDHSNGTRFFKNAKIYIGWDDASALEDKDDNVMCSSYFDQEYSGRSDIHIKLKGSSVLPLKNDFTLYVIETPGHTHGGICLYDKRRKTLFTGDTLFDNTYGRVDLPGGDKEEMKNSLKKLEKIDFGIVYPGHGKVFERNQNTFKSLRI